MYVSKYVLYIYLCKIYVNTLHSIWFEWNLKLQYSVVASYELCPKKFNLEITVLENYLLVDDELCKTKILIKFVNQSKNHRSLKRMKRMELKKEHNYDNMINDLYQ